MFEPLAMVRISRVYASSELPMQSTQPALTKEYLNKRFQAAGVAVVVGLLLAIVVGWTSMSYFRSHGKFAYVVTEFIQAVDRFEADILSVSTAGAQSNFSRRGLQLSFRDAVEISSLFRERNNPKKAETYREWRTLERAMDISFPALKARYSLTGQSLAREFGKLTASPDGSGVDLEGLINEFVILGARLVDTKDVASASFRRDATTLRELTDKKLRPILHSAIRKIGDGTSDIASTAFYVIIFCSLVGIAISTGSALIILWPMQDAVIGTQNALVRERSRAQASEKARHDFLAIVGHELRTPLNSILGFCNLLMGTSLGAKQKDYAETIQTAGQSLLALLNDVADIAQIESGTLELQKRDFSLETIAADVIEQARAQAYTKRLDLSAYIDPNLPIKISGDAARAQQVLLKLVSNAITYTERGGVSVEIKRYGNNEDGSFDVMFSVTDTGIGIPKNQVALVFDHFGYIDVSASRKHAGTGIGLPVCKKLVHLLGGEMGVESTLFKGSTFWFRAKLNAVVPPAEKIRDSLNADFTGRRFLVVEHDELTRSVFRYQLESFSAEVDCVSDARSAINALIESDRRGRTYDIAIIDHETPEIDGIDLRKTIREAPEFRDVRLVIAASDGIAYDQQARALGFEAACPKPIVQAKMIGLMKEVLERPTHSDIVSMASSLTAVGETNSVPETVSEPEEQPACILVAEDNIINQRLVMAALTQAGYVVDSVGDGVEALQAMQAKSYDLVLMDIRMPVMSGVDATRHIRALPGENGKCPIIAMTANTLPGDREEYLAAGMNEYIPKPIDFPGLLGKIDDYLHGRVSEAAETDDDNAENTGPKVPKRRRRQS
jgi:signal transduction histidine kinase/CheY-like chemotaxis protein